MAVGLVHWLNHIFSTRLSRIIVFIVQQIIVNEMHKIFYMARITLVMQLAWQDFGQILETGYVYENYVQLADKNDSLTIISLSWQIV